MEQSLDECLLCLLPSTSSVSVVVTNSPVGVADGQIKIERVRLGWGEWGEHDQTRLKATVAVSK